MSAPRRGVIAWFAHNPVAANLLMVVIMVLGLAAAFNIQRAMLPEVDFELIDRTVRPVVCARWCLTWPLPMCAWARQWSAASFAGLSWLFRQWIA